MAGSRAAKLRAMAEHPSSNPFEAEIARDELQRMRESHAAETIEKAFAGPMRALGFPAGVPIRWVQDAAAGYKAAWFFNGSAAEMGARATWRRNAPAIVGSRAVREACWIAACAANGGRSAAHDMAWFADDLAAFQDAADAGLWMFWLMGAEIVAVPRPLIHLEDRRLHNGQGPAVEWPSGEVMYFWRGTEVPADWILRRESIRPEWALSWPNVEQRRAAAEMIGWVRVIERLPHRLIDKHPNPMVGELIEVDLPDVQGVHFLKVLCGTGRTFCLCVPRECRTAIEAQCSMWPGLSEAEVMAALTKGKRA